MFLLFFNFFRQIPKGAVLIIIDGFGESSWMEGNGIALAKTPTLDFLKSNFIYTSLSAAQQSVGLISMERGSSSVGHQTIGLGRTVPSYYQMLEKGMNPNSSYSILNNQKIRNLYQKSKKFNSTVHFAGLCTETGVFSHIKFLQPMFQAASEENVKEILIHCFFNSQATKPSNYIKIIESYFPNNVKCKIASAHSPTTSLDRFRNWNLTEKSYQTIANGAGALVVDRDSLLKRLDLYSSKKMDYKPFIISPVSESILKENDVLILFNHREDQSYQITERLINGHLTPKNVEILPMILYDPSLSNISTILPSITYNNSLGSWISQKGFKQLRTAESYKKYHISEFFSGGITQPIFEGEERETDYNSISELIVDKFPYMNSSNIFKIVQRAISNERYKLIAANFANIDACGHTGNYTAVKIALEYLDNLIKKIWKKCETHNYALFITSDHGNGEENLNLDGTPMQDHTINNVPFISTINGMKLKKLKIGKNPYLGNVAPSILHSLNIDIPPEMDESILFDSESFSNNYTTSSFLWFSIGTIFGIIFMHFLTSIFKHSRIYQTSLYRKQSDQR